MASLEPRSEDADELLRWVVESAKDYAIFSVDPSRRVTSWNSGAERLFGYSESEMLGRSADILYTPEDRANAVPELEARKALEDGRAEDHRWHLRKGDARFFVAGMVRPMRDDGGALRGFLKIAQDITDKRHAEAALQEQANLLDLSHDAIFVWQLHGAVSYWNRGAEELYGFAREEAGGRRPHELLQTRQPGMPVSVIEHLERTGAWTGELCHTRKDGRALLVESRQVLIRRQNAEPVVLESNRDISERSAAEEALREREAQLQLAIAIAEMGTFDIDLPTDAVVVNEAGRTIYGWDPDLPLTFSKVQTHFHPDDREEVMRRVGAAFDPAGPGKFNLEQRIVRSDGMVRWIRVLGQVFFGGMRQPVRCLGTYTDISPLKDAEAVLRDANRRKDEFLAMLGHELRNPLAAIRNALEVANLAENDRETADWSKAVVDRQTAQLARLVDDLLEVSRITSGKIRLRKQMIDVAPFLRQAADVVRPLISARRHELITIDGVGEALLVEADATRLEQIIVNLLTNAAKYTEVGGRIWLGAVREDAHVLISVRDTGVGISPEKLPQMFELFAQGERSIARAEGGLGLGLTIVRMLSEMHGGSVTASSEGPGKGSVFTVRLPAAAGARPAQNAPETSASDVTILQGAKVLVVDDHLDTAEGVARLLRRRGCSVTVAHDGPAALELARALHPQFVLLDIGLPGMDGYELAVALRAEACCAEAMIVAISGYGQEEDYRLSKNAGFNHHLVKPVDFAQLESILSTSGK